MDDLAFWIGVVLFCVFASTCHVADGCNKATAYSACVSAHSVAECKELKP